MTDAKDQSSNVVIEVKAEVKIGKNILSLNQNLHGFKINLP
jgi:hypothetical protein